MTSGLVVAGAGDEPVGQGPAGSAEGLRLVADPEAVDSGAASRAVRRLLLALGQDLSSAHLADTPRRVAAALQETLTPAPFTFTTFPNDAGYDGLVMVRDISFTSLCAHHLLPFQGVAHVGYLPGQRLVGLSKLARVVEMFSRRLQVQEALAAQVAEWLQEQLSPRGLGVVVEAEHQCMSARGARAAGSWTVTSALFGLVRDDGRTREEFLALARGGSS